MHYWYRKRYHLINYCITGIALGVDGTLLLSILLLQVEAILLVFIISFSLVVVETDRLIKEKNQKRQEAIQDISKAVQLQLGIQPVEKQPYKMPLSAENSVNSDNCKGKKPLFSFDVEKSISELTCRDQDVLPSHPVLSSKRKIFCRQCKSVGSGLLCNFNLQPLGGDSTL